MNIELDTNIVTFIGPPDSGKSTLVKRMLTYPEYRSHLVYDPLFGFDPSIHNVITPPTTETKFRRYEKGNPELNTAVDDFIINAKPENRPKIFVVDEAGRLLPNHKDEGGPMGELNDFNEHYGVGVWLLAQRHTQINTDFENKATHHFITGYKGKNDKRNLDDLHENAQEYVDAQSEYGFTYIGPNGKIQNFAAIEPFGEKSML